MSESIADVASSLHEATSHFLSGFGENQSIDSSCRCDHSSDHRDGVKAEKNV